MKKTDFKNKDFKKARKIELPIYPFGIHFCMLSEEGKKQFKYEKQEGRTVKEGQDIYLYFTETISFETAVHELFHITEFIMEEIGQPLSKCPNETWAYLIGYLSDEFNKFFRIK